MYERIYKKDPIYAKTIMFLFSDLCNESHIEFDNKNICSICLEDGNKKSIFKLITDPCKTYYCIDCFNTWIKENTTCPGCRNFLMITKGSKYKINKISCKIEKYINNKYENNNNYGRGDRYYYNRNYFY
jgi:LSD1 subclass zinc finger protein